MKVSVVTKDELDTAIDQLYEKFITFLESRQPLNPREDYDRYISKKDAARFAAVSTSTIDNWGRSKKITRHYFGGVVRFWLPELKKFLSEQAIGSHDE